MITHGIEINLGEARCEGREIVIRFDREQLWVLLCAALPPLSPRDIEMFRELLPKADFVEAFVYELNNVDVSEDLESPIGQVLVRCALLATRRAHTVSRAIKEYLKLDEVGVAKLLKRDNEAQRLRAKAELDHIERKAKSKKRRSAAKARGKRK